jgi:hypothetical protein
MRIREENCNLVLLAGVTLVSAGIAGAAALLEPAAATGKGRPFYIAAAASSPSAAVASSPSADAASSPSVSAAVTSPAAEKKPARLVDQTPVRVVGAPFVPNTNPRER